MLFPWDHYKLELFVIDEFSLPDLRSILLPAIAKNLKILLVVCRLLKYGCAFFEVVSKVTESFQLTILSLITFVAYIVKFARLGLLSTVVVIRNKSALPSNDLSIEARLHDLRTACCSCFLTASRWRRTKVVKYLRGKRRKVIVFSTLQLIRF